MHGLDEHGNRADLFIDTIPLCSRTGTMDQLFMFIG